MMRNFNGYLRLSIFLISALLIIPEKGSGQEPQNHRDEILTLVNSVYGADDRLINGKYYQPKHYYAEGYPYFLSKDWSEASLYIKGTAYKHVNTKYNIEDDVIIIQHIFKNRISKNILLNNSFVDSLIIGTHVFHNTSNFLAENSIGIAELIYKGKLLAYTKHTIKFIEDHSERYKYGLYLKPQRKLHLFDGDSFYLIESKKDFLAHFPKHTKEINSFLRKRRIRFKKASNEEINTLLHFCEEL